MKCDEFEDRLNEVLDERRRPEWEAELRLHCEGCAGCRELAGSYGVLLDGFYALKTPQPPADMGHRVVAELRVRRSVALATSAAAAVLATAAAVLVAVLPLLQSPSRRFEVVQSSAQPPLVIASAAQKAEIVRA